jgi:ABC-type sugar transport system permease subunit
MTTVNNLNTHTVVMQIYREGISANRVGMAAAMSFLVALMMISVTLASNLILRNRNEA